MAALLRAAILRSRKQPRRRWDISDDPERVWPTGLNLKEVEEVHSYLIDGTRVFGAIALLAHMLVAITSPWLGERRHHISNAKMWLVVPPVVGSPVFLGAVAVGAFAVHVVVLSNTLDVDTAKASDAKDLEEADQIITVILPDGTTANAVLRTHEVPATAAYLVTFGQAPPAPGGLSPVAPPPNT